MHLVFLPIEIEADGVIFEFEWGDIFERDVKGSRCKLTLIYEAGNGNFWEGFVKWLFLF